MADDLPLPPRPGPPPFVRSFLDRIQEMEAREALHPAQLEERAVALLDDRLGPSEQAVAAGSANASVGLIADHTHLFDGFAVTLGLRQATAVAVRTVERGPSLVVLEGQGVRWSFGVATRDVPPLVVRFLEALLDRVLPERFVQVAVVTTIPEAANDAALSALGTALVRALRALPDGDGLPPPPEVPTARGLPSAHTDATLGAIRAAQSDAGLLTGVPYPLAAATTPPHRFAVLDAATRETILLDAPDPLTVAWAVVDVSPAWGGDTWVQDEVFYTERLADVAAIVRHLRNVGFPVGALRDLEHATLDAAVQAVPGPLRGTLRHLVSENRLVQKLIGAIRRADWQLLGALLAMSHHNRVRWGEIGPLGVTTTHVVEQAQAMTLDGVFGAGLSGRGGSVLLVGRPHSLPGALERITETFRDRYGVAPVTRVL